MTTTTIGCLAPGSRHRLSARSGRLATGAGAADLTPGMAVIGAHTSVSTVASITVMVTAAPDIRAVIGIMARSTITAA